MSGLPQQPYLLRALYEWCVDSGYTPYINVRVDSHTRVPSTFVRDGQIVLNIGPNAVRNLHMGNEWVSFTARFGGVAQALEIPVGNVVAIYARETGEGMVFAVAPEATPEGAPSEPAAAQPQAQGPDKPSGKPKGRPKLRVVK